MPGRRPSTPGNPPGAGQESSSLPGLQGLSDGWEIKRVSVQGMNRGADAINVQKRKCLCKYLVHRKEQRRVKIRDHINSFQALESYYFRKDNREKIFTVSWVEKCSVTRNRVVYLPKFYKATSDLSFFPSTASTSQEDRENISGSTSSRNLTVTLLSSEWRSTKRRLSTINRELAIQLAKHPSVEVIVYLPQCSEEDKRVSASHNVQLIEAEEMVGYDNPVDWLSSLLDGHVVDCVIHVGHGAILGGQVHVIKRHCNCKWIQVVHTAPEELGEKKHQAEIKLCEKAD
ncbi:unnamed protein product [Porites lobata]|uniref:Uncharacterized protein n=1 Tax=Porites lobata TaxID=104759 RepID=A0ABN8N1C2_9CNID|nr:unnamed protein product [Porites lobata]